MAGKVLVAEIYDFPSNTHCAEILKSMQQCHQFILASARISIQSTEKQPGGEGIPVTLLQYSLNNALQLSTGMAVDQQLIGYLAGSFKMRIEVHFVVRGSEQEQPAGKVPPMEMN